MKLGIVPLSLSLSLSVPSRCRSRSWLIFAYTLHFVIKCIGFGGNAKIESMVNTPLCFEMSLSTLAIFFTPLPFKLNIPIPNPSSLTASTQPQLRLRFYSFENDLSSSSSTKNPSSAPDPETSLAQPKRKMSPLTSRTSVTKVNSMATYYFVWLPRKLE